jgi:Glycosyl transferase family 2
VSVAIPVCNEHKVLPELLERLRAIADGPCSQDDFEFIFVDHPASTWSASSSPPIRASASSTPS